MHADHHLSPIYLPYISPTSQVSELDLVWISHMHADHHLGLLSLLQVTWLGVGVGLGLG